MKTLNNDWDTVEFEPTSINEARINKLPKTEPEGHDPYNSSTRLRKVNERDVDAWFLNFGK